jgi:hypothetical protein
MEKLDRLGWTAGISFRAYGLDLGVRVSDARVLGALEASLPYGSTVSDLAGVDHLYSVVVGRDGEDAPRRFGAAPTRRKHILLSGTDQIARGDDFEEIRRVFESHVRLLVAEFARGRVFVHAGVVGWRGRAILVPGRSHTGKTSLVAALVRAGATYYSDEYAVLDLRGRVHPFLKPLSIRERDHDHRQTDVPVEAIGGKSGTKPLPVGCVLLTEFKRGARWRPKPVTPGQAALGLLANTVPARRDPATVVEVLRRVADTAAAFKCPRGEAEDVAARVLRLSEGD